MTRFSALLLIAAACLTPAIALADTPFAASIVARAFVAQQRRAESQARPLAAVAAAVSAEGEALSEVFRGVALYKSEEPREADATQIRLKLVPRSAGTVLVLAGSF